MRKLQTLWMLAALVALLPAAYARGADQTPAETELKFHEWRLAPERLEAKMEKEHAGRGPAVKVRFAARDAGGKPGTLKLAEESCGRPLFPFIPPYIGTSAQQVSMAVYPVAKIQAAEFGLELTRHNGPPIGRKIAWEELKAGQWTEIVVPVDCTPAQSLSGVNLNFSGAGEMEIYLAEIRILRSNQTVYELLNSRPPLYCEGLDQPLAPVARALPERATLNLGVCAKWPIENASSLAEVGRIMAQYFPEYDLVIAGVWTPEPKLAEVLPKFLPNMFYQFQKAQYDPRYLGLKEALPRNGNGQNLTVLDNQILATHPLMQAALRDQIDYAASLGINNFKQVDYVWPWMGGRWGYDAASVAAFREDLAAADEGLEVLTGVGQSRRVVHFWDYFADYHGLRFAPADLGLAGWEQFVPITEQAAATADAAGKRNLGVFVALCNYEWLRQAQRFGRWAQAHGGKHDYTLNPEDLGNAGDHIYLLRLAAAGIPYLEYFGSPGQLQAVYRTSGIYIRAARELGKKIGYITEIGQGGHFQPYFDSRVAYAFSYELSALGFDSYHNEWLNEAPWKDLLNPDNGYHHTRFRNWMAQGLAFRQAKLDRAAKLPAVDVLNVSLRSVGFYIGNFWSLGQMDSWGPALAEAQVNFEQTDPQELPRRLEQARVIFYAPPVSRPEIAAQLEAWLAQGGKTLVTHSYIPFSHDRGRADLKESVQDVAFSGKDFDYADYVADLAKQADTPLFKDFAPGRPAGRTVVAGADGKPLLTLNERPGGSRVYYLHSRPASVAPEALAQVMTRLAADLNLPLLMGGADAATAMVNRYQNDVCQIVTLWNRTEITKTGFGGGYGEHLMPKRSAKEYDPKVYPYKSHLPGAFCQATLSLDKPGQYRVYRFLADQEEVVEVGPQRQLTLTQKDEMVDVYYLAEDSEAFRQSLVPIKAERAKIAAFIQEPQD